MSLDPEQAEAQIRSALAAGRAGDACDALLRTWGEDLYGFVVAIMRDDVAADEVYAMFAEDLWRGIGGFRGEAKLRTWAYVLARNAAARYRRDPLRRRGVALSDSPEAARLVQQARTSTRTWKRSSAREHVRRLREALEIGDQELLVLRVDRGLEWDEIALVLADDGEADTPLQRKRRAAALRKRFERVKARLKVLARSEGLLDD